MKVMDVIQLPAVKLRCVIICEFNVMTAHIIYIATWSIVLYTLYCSLLCIVTFSKKHIIWRGNIF